VVADIKIMKAVEFDKLPAKFKKQYPNEDALEAAGYWLQRKYDGCFGMAYVAFDATESKMLSRTGEDYTAACRHILDELHDAATEQSGSWDDFIVIGELWLPGTDFPTISGKFRKRAASTLQFIANDLLPAGLVTHIPYRQRYDDLLALLPPLNAGQTAYCFVAETYRSGQWTDAHAHANLWKAEGGFDGAILRNPDAGYTIGLVKNGEIVKVKPALSLDLRCVAIKQERGEKTGRPVYTMTVNYKGVWTTVGSGMPHNIKDVPRPGDIVEVECMGLTEDGKLREPRFKGIRYDKDKADE
jgi:ATP-dependent DNA ligase